MSSGAATAVAAPDAAPKIRTLTAAPEPMVQKQCACGAMEAAEVCPDCRNKRLAFRARTAPVRAMRSSAHQVQSQDVYEREAEQMAAIISSLPVQPGMPALSRRGLGVQRAPADGGEPEPPQAQPEGQQPESAQPEAAPAPTPAAQPTAEGAASGSLIVEDDVKDLAPGQMRRSDFMARLQETVCTAAEASLAAAGRSTKGCPYLDFWFSYYGKQDSQRIERAVHKFAPETEKSTAASDYISAITTRLTAAIATWATTGKITGVPEDAAADAPAGAPKPASDDDETLDREGGGSIRSRLGRILFKRSGSGSQASPDPAAVQSQLQSGRPLDDAVRSRMEPVFGHDFSGVRIYNDAHAARLSGDLDARAFTVGRDIAFGAGQYRPGTPTGDALIAHELAHVVQQGVARESTSGPASVDLEQDADRSAAGVVASLWTNGVGAAADIAKNALPRLRSGLQIQRCGCSKADEHLPTAPIKPIMPSLECNPEAKSLDDIRKFPGVPAGVLGLTHRADIKWNQHIRGVDGGTCNVTLTDPPSFALDIFVYTKPGTYDIGPITPAAGHCKGKSVKQMEVITQAMSDKIKEGEAEHCKDNKIAYSLSWSKYLQAVQELDGGYCSEGSTCKATFEDRFKSRVGVEAGKKGDVARCLSERSGQRDTKDWHTVVVDLAKGVWAKDCSTVTLTPDPTTMKDVGTHKSEDLVKGCGE